jgi:hypothetical protein
MIVNINLLPKYFPANIAFMVEHLGAGEWSFWDFCIPAGLASEKMNNQ